ncbi:MAG TPA: O-antigen ligase family protein, partial [Dehalococcoidia bacterium]|nr:O-antigen ligase family protein [Dehalococcoidia bacterium]
LALGLITVQRRWRRALVPLGAAALMLAVFYLTFSRGAWLGLIAAALFLLFAADRRAGLLTLVGILVLGLTLVPVLPWERLLSITPFVQRLLVWQAALAMVLDHPLTGVGLDNFLYHYPQYILPQAAFEPDISHAHNVFLDFWSRLGILGLATLVWLQYQFWRMGVSVLRGAPTPQERWLALALMASMVDFLVHGLIDNSYFLIDLAYIFWLTYGLLAVLYHSPAKVALATGSTST